jgi:hypothetical protein
MSTSSSRAIVSLAVATGEGLDGLYAACADGSVWYITPFKDPEWSRLPNIPEAKNGPAND